MDSREKSFVTSSSDWKNISSLISRHLRDSSPHYGNSDAAELFLSIYYNKDKNICQLLNKAHDEKLKSNKRILQTLFETIALCRKQNIPLRGHTESSSNFLAILEYRAKTDPELATHLLSGTSKGKYLSPSIRNEMINILGGQILESLVKECNDAGPFSLMADETTDKSTTEQVSICVRFLDSSFNLREEFLCFVDTDSTTREVLANLFVQELGLIGIDLENIVGQGYDGAGNMKGNRKGVQKRIRDLYPKDLYVHCHAHCLNLALVHASSIQSIKNMMGVVQDISFAFSYSSKRMAQYQESLETTDHQLGRRKKLRELCETRWSARADALYTFINSFDVVVDALKMLAEDGDEKATFKLYSILRFEFLVNLCAAEHVLQNTVELSTILQKKSIDLVEASKETNVVIELITRERSSEETWSLIYNKAKEMAQKHQITIEKPRTTGRQIHRSNIDADTVEQFYQRNVFYPFVDHLLNEIKDRFVVPSGRFSAQKLIPTRLDQIQDNDLQAMHDEYKDIMPNPERFQAETRRWIVKWEQERERPSDLLTTLRSTSSYPNIQSVLKTLAPMPVSTATAELSFSALKRIKNYLRSTMGQERLSNLALLHLYRDFTFNLDKAITVFNESKTRRLQID